MLVSENGEPKAGCFNFINTSVLFKIGFIKETLRKKFSGWMPPWNRNNRMWLTKANIRKMLIMDD